MPYALRKARGKDAYWVVNKETGEKFSHDPLPRRRAEAQQKALYAAESRKGSGKDCGCGGGMNCKTRTGGISASNAYKVYKAKKKVNNFIDDLTGGAEEVKETQVDLKEREKLINELMAKGMKPAEAVKKVTSSFKADLEEKAEEVKEKAEEKASELLTKKGHTVAEAKKLAGMGKRMNALYLSEQFKKAFPRNQKTGAALKKQMTSWIEGQLKEMDCGCGCKGMKKLAELAGKAHPDLKKEFIRAKMRLEHGHRLKHRILKGGKMIDCPAGYRNDGLTCIEECRGDETDEGLTCKKNCPQGYRSDAGACRKCPPGYTDTGLTCLEDCKAGETDTGLFCKKGCPSGWREDPEACRRCPPGYTDTGATCFKPASGGKCYGGDCNTWWEPHCVYWGLGNWSGCHKTSCNPIRCDPIINADSQQQEVMWRTRTKDSQQQEVIWRAVRGKDIKGRVDVQGTMEEISAGLKEAFSADGALARAFDPEKNGVAEAFRKFGKDTEEAFAKVGNELLKAFDPEQNGVGAAFRQFGEAINNTLGNADWWKETMTNPDTYIMLLGMIASAAATVLSAGTLGPAAFIALNALGPAMKMIGDAAQGRPIDGLDIAGLVMGLVPLPGAGAAAKAASDAIIKGAAFGTVAAKALPYVQKAVQVGKFVAEGVKVAQDLGVVPSTCLANCPPPPPPPEDENQGCDGECLKLAFDPEYTVQGDCNCEDAEEGDALDEDLEDEAASIDFGDEDEDAGFGEAVVDNVDDEVLDEAAEAAGLDEEDMGEVGLEELMPTEEEEEPELDEEEEAELEAEVAPEEEEFPEEEEASEAEEEMEEDEEGAEEGEETMSEYNEEEEEQETEGFEEGIGETPNAELEADVMGETIAAVPSDAPCMRKFYRIYGVEADKFLDLPHDIMEEVAESKGHTHEEAMDAAHKAVEKSGAGRRRRGGLLSDSIVAQMRGKPQPGISGLPKLPPGQMYSQAQLQAAQNAEWERERNMSTKEKAIEAAKLAALGVGTAGVLYAGYKYGPQLAQKNAELQHKYLGSGRRVVF